MGVGQLIGKFFGGDADKGEVILRAYGKLPFYAEYRRLEVSPGAATAFSQWLDAGRLAWVRSSARTDGGVTRASRLLVGLPDAKEAIVASVWDSRDNLGRVFPFAFFVVCPPAALGDDAVERWAAAAAIHRLFDVLHTRIHSLGSGGDFYRVFRKHAVSLRPDDLEQRVRDLRAEAAAIQAQPWFDALGLPDKITSAEWFAGLARRAQRWSNQPAAIAETGMTCPLARGFPRDAQVVLWLEWLAGLFKKTGRTPWLIVPSDETAPTISLVMRGLLPDDFQLLTTDDGTYNYIEHLSQVPVAEARPITPQTSETSETAKASGPPTESLLTWLKTHAP